MPTKISRCLELWSRLIFRQRSIFLRHNRLHLSKRLRWRKCPSCKDSTTPLPLDSTPNWRECYLLLLWHWNVISTNSNTKSSPWICQQVHFISKCRPKTTVFRARQSRLCINKRFPSYAILAKLCQSNTTAHHFAYLWQFHCITTTIQISCPNKYDVNSWTTLFQTTNLIWLPSYFHYSNSYP